MGCISKADTVRDEMASYHIGEVLPHNPPQRIFAFFVDDPERSGTGHKKIIPPMNGIDKQRP
jgi:hypothetical protein